MKNFLLLIMRMIIIITQLFKKVDETSLSYGIKGMCRNATRKFVYENGVKFRLPPLLYAGYPLVNEENEIAVVVTVVHITDPEDYQIFSRLLEGNITAVVELIDAHRGVNAVDEWGEVFDIPKQNDIVFIKI